MTGATTLSDTLDVTGNTIISGTGEVKETLSLTKQTGTGLDVHKNATVGGDLSVTGTITATGGVNGDVTGNADTASAAKSGSTLESQLQNLDTATGDLNGNADTASAAKSGSTLEGQVQNLDTSTGDLNGNADTATKTKGLLDIETSLSGANSRKSSTNAKKGEMFLETHGTTHKFWICIEDGNVTSTPGTTNWKYSGLF